MIIRAVNLTTSLLASALRFGAGGPGARTTAEKTPILYEFEGCPFCRVAREAVSDAGLEVMVRPCPKRGERFRPDVSRLGGKAQFPYFIDPNTDTAMYESADIARYLARTYGGGSVLHWLGPVNLVLSQIATLARFAAGTFVTSATVPEQPLILHGPERNPAVRLAKEALCVAEIEYRWCPDGPFRLVDPNSGDEFANAAMARRHLKQTYRQ